MKYDNQLRYASRVVREYDGKVPLSASLKDFFRANKQMGSTDRKTVSEMVYGYYRLGYNEFPSVEDRILAFLKISGNLPELKSYFFSHDSEEALTDPAQFSVQKIFPFKQSLSPGIDYDKFCVSFLVQPDLFIRIRPGHNQAVLSKLESNDVKFRLCSSECIAMLNTTKIDTILDLNVEAVVQDRSSQRSGELLKQLETQTERQVALWDCCAASGGKTIMAYDILGNIEITVSDIRESIITNLRDRFLKAGIRHYTTFVADLTNPQTGVPDSEYDIVIADVPCTGSGTWARTPEQLYFFKKEKIDYYSSLQKQIVAKVIPSLKPSGALLYITCSVFQKENEEVVDDIMRNSGLRLVTSGLIKGYEEKADTLFSALFINSSA